MRYRKLDSAGDYTFGQSQGNFHIDSPLGVAQAIKTRLNLGTGEWFLNKAEGTPYDSQILGSNTWAIYDTAIKDRILGTEGVTEITSYESSVDPTTRTLSVTATVDTLYGTTSITTIVGV